MSVTAAPTPGSPAGTSVTSIISMSMQTAPTTGTRRPRDQRRRVRARGADSRRHIRAASVATRDGRARAPLAAVADGRPDRNLVHRHDARREPQRRLPARQRRRRATASRRTAPARDAPRRTARAGKRTAAALLAAWLRQLGEPRAPRRSQAAVERSQSLLRGAASGRSADARWVQSPASRSAGRSSSAIEHRRQIAPPRRRAGSCRCRP